MTNISNSSQLNTFNSVTLIQFFWKWRKTLFLVIIVTFVLSSIISLLITPKYKSTVIMFPTSTNSISKALLSDFYGLKQDVMEFGEEEQSEQLLQVLHSSIIRDRISQKFNLYKHYKIPENAKARQTRLIKEYNNNIKFRRTQYMAVEISVLDKDAQMAADIANDIASLLDTIMNNMQKERAVRGYEIVEHTFNKLKLEIQEIEDSLSFLRTKGIHDYESQAERLYESLSKELASGNMRGIKAIEERLDTLAKYGSAFVSLRDQLEHEKKQLSAIKTKYEEAKVDAEEFLPHKFIVDHAYKAEKKSYPVRWLIVIVSTFSTFFFTLVIIIIKENIKDLFSKNAAL
jgi:uncharacterized protein involved in exopolysaccharide biosynthesis